MSQTASFYFHVDADGAFWWPLFLDEATATYVDGDIFGSSAPGSHTHVYDGFTYYMPNTMGSAENPNGSFHGVVLTGDQIDNLRAAGGADIDGQLIEGEDREANLVTDGTFDGTDTWIGNAYNPIEGENQAFVETAGNAWDVNLSGIVALEPGSDYTLQFDVSGTPGRTFIAGIGMNGPDDFSNHANTVTINDETQTIVMHLNASAGGTGADFGDTTSRVLFDMGADTGAVNIDNVSLVSGHIGTPYNYVPPEESDASIDRPGDLGSDSDNNSAGDSGNNNSIDDDYPYIDQPYSREELISIFPALADAANTDLDYPLIPSGNIDEWPETFARLASGLTIYVIEWNSEKIIVSHSTEDTDPDYLMKLNIADDPIAQNTNFVANQQFILDFQSGAVSDPSVLASYIDSFNGIDDDLRAPSYDSKYELQQDEAGYTGTDGADAIKFGIGDNQLVNGGAGDDFIYSYSGTGDVLVGSSGNDVLQVRTLREVIEVEAGEFPEVVVTSAVTTHSYGNDFPMGLFGFVITGTDVDFSSVDITATVRGPNGEAQIFPYSAEGAGFISAGSLNDKTMIVMPSGTSGDVVNGAYFDIIALDPDPGSYELLNVTASQNGNTIASVEPDGVYFEIVLGQDATTPSTTFYYDSVAVAYGSEPVTQVFGGDIDENGNPTSDDSDNDTLFLTGLSQDYSIALGADTDAGEVILRNNLTGGTVIAKQIENFTFQFGYNQETIALNDLPIDARLQTELEYQENPGPVIEAVLPTADLVNLVPEFAGVGDANLDLPLVFRNKPTGEAYIELGAPVAETDALYLYVAEWQGESIILGSPKNYYSEALFKLNLAADPIAQNTNFEIDVDFYTSFATGEIRSFEALSQYIDDPDNAFGLGPLEILTEQPDISNVPDIGDIDVESLKYIKLTPGSDRYDNVLGTDALNVIAGDGGDNIVASSGADFIDGGNGNDTIRSNPGNDVVLGGLGDDVFLKDFGPAYVPTPAEGARAELLTSVAGPSGITGEGIGYWSFGITDAGGRLTNNVQASVNTPFGQIDLNGYQGTLYAGDTIIVASVLAAPSSSGIGSSVGIILTAVEYDFETQETENVELPAGQYSLNYAAFSAGSEFLTEVGGDVLYDKVLDIESEPVNQVRQYTNNDPSLGYLENSDNIDGGEHFDIFRTVNPKGDFQLFDGEEFAVLVHKTSGETIKLTNVEQIEFSNATVSLASGTGQNAPETPRPDIEYFSESFVDLQGNSVIEYFAEGGAKDDLIVYQGNISGGAGNDIIIEDSDENLTPIGDIMAGGKGNDFIDGGRQGNGGSNDNFNVADYDGPVRNFSFETKVYSAEADKAEIDALIVDLGLEAAADYLVDGQTYFIVTDARGDGGQGTDIVTNVQEFSFTDDYLILEATAYTNEYAQEVWPDGFYIAPGMTPLETSVMERPAYWNPDDTESYYGGSNGWDVYEYELDGGAADASYVVFFKRHYDGAPAYDGYVDGPVYQRDAEGNYTPVRIDHVVLEGSGSAIADDIIDASTHEDSPTQANLSGAGGNDVLIGTSGNDRLEGNAGNDFIDAKGSSDRDELNYYNIKQSRFEISSMTYSDGADKTALDALIVDLDLSHAADYLVDGQQYLIVEDKRGASGEGTDVVANIEAISFKDNYVRLAAEEYVRTDFFDVYPEDFYVSAADTPAASAVQERVQSGGYVEQFNQSGQNHGWDAYAYDYAQGEEGGEYFVLFRRYDENSNQGEGYIDGGVYRLNDNGQYQVVTQEVVRLDSYGSAYANDILDASARDDNPTSAWMEGKGGDDVLIGTLGADELRGDQGDDFIDGRGSSAKTNRWDEDRVRYEGKESQYALTYYDMTSADDVSALQALVEVLGLNIDSYLDTEEGYYISVADKVGGRDGTDIVTGVDRVEFNDNSLRLTVEERTISEERQLQTPWSWQPAEGEAHIDTINAIIEPWGGTYSPWNQDAQWRVYAYDDGDDSTDYYVVYNYEEYEWGAGGWPEALVTRSDDGQGGFAYTRASETITRYEATGSFLPDVITTDADDARINAGAGNDIVTLAKQGFVEAGAGNDIIYGGTGPNEIYGNGGNDVIVGGDNAGGEDRASYRGQQKFFDIYQLRYAGSDMNIKDALGESIYTVTAQENGSGILRFADGGGDILTLSNGDSFIVVNDLLPAKFGGQGVDLLTGIERISFYGDDYSEIQTGVYFWDDTWNTRTEANGSIFDDVIDLREGRAVSVEAITARGGRAENIQAQGQLHASNMRGEEGNDVMLGGYGQDFFNPGKGDDFIDGGSASDLAALVTTMDAFRSDVTLTDPKTSADGVFDVYRVHNDRDEYWALRDDNTLFKVNYNEQQDTLASPDLSDQNNNDRWSNNDTVQYSGTRLRYEISTVYVQLDENGLPVRDLAGAYNVIEAADYSDEAGYEQFFRVKDVLPDAAGGVGTDYLRNIEELYFSDGNEQLVVVTDRWTDRYDRNDWSWQPPRDNNGDYDLSGNVGTIDGFTSMWGGFNEKWNENAEWLVFKYLDSNGDQVFEDSHGIYVIWNSEGDWGHPIRLVRQDGAGGFTEVFNTQERANVRGTFADDIIYQTSDANSNDEIYANEGNDIILAGEGRDRIKGGEGNDVIFGGGQTSIGWDYNGDIAYYGSSSSQYIITRNIFVKPTDNVVETDDRGRFIVYSEGEVAGRGIKQGETELALTSDNGFVEVTIVTDTLPGAQGGEGVDILVGIEGLVFGSASNWLPHVGSYARSGDSVGGDDGGVFVGLSTTLAINAYQYGNTTKVDADLYGTEFDDNIALPAADSNIFSRDGIGYLGSQVTNAFFKTDAGNDSYTGNEAVFSEVHYDGAEEDYEVASNTDGSISVKHLVVGEDNTGIDTLISIDKIVFGEGSSGEERSEVLLSLDTRSYDDYNHLTGTNFDDVIDMRSGLSFATEKNSYNRTYDGEFTKDTVQYHDRFWAGSGNDIMLGGYGGDLFYSDAGDDFIDGGRASDLDAILAASTSVAQNVSLVDPESSVDGLFDVYFVLSGERNGERGEYWALRDNGSSFRVDADKTDPESITFTATDLGDQTASYFSDDSVQYNSGTKARYVIDEVYIKIGGNGHPVRTADGYDTIEVADYDSEAGYEKVTRVTDKLPELAGGTGTDYLKNVDVLQFSDGEERLSTESNSWTDRYDRNDWSWQPPRDGNGDFDLSGSVGTISEYSTMWGGVNSPWNENVEWRVFRYTDANGDAVTEDGVNLYIIWNSENSWGWPERIVTQDGNGGYTEAFYTQARSNIRGTLFDDVINETADLSSNDEIVGNQGDDLIFSGDGRDRIKGGEGNDVIWGGNSNSVGHDFNGDIAYFEAPQDQYKIISGAFVKPEMANGEFVTGRPETDAEGRFIVYSVDTELVGRGIVRQDTSEDLTEANGYFEATIVIDTLADELGGEGVDILLGVEGVVFGSTSLPNVDSWVSSGDIIFNDSKFLGLKATTVVETYDGVRVRIKGTDFADSVSLDETDVFFDSDNRAFGSDEVNYINVEASEGNDTFDLRYFADQVEEPFHIGMNYGSNAASEYYLERTGDGGVRIEHLVGGPNNTGVDIVYGVGEITFSTGQSRTYAGGMDNNNVGLSLLGDDLNSDHEAFALIQDDDNEIRAVGGYGHTSNVDAGGGTDTLRMEDAPIWQVGITYEGGVWTVSNNMGQSYGSNGTVNATNFEYIRLEHRGDLTAQLNISDPDNVTINVGGNNYTVSSYGADGSLLNSDGENLLEDIIADLGFEDGTINGTDNDDEIHALPGDQIIFGGSETLEQQWYGYGDQYRISGVIDRYDLGYKYDEDSDDDGFFDVSGVAVTGNEGFNFEGNGSFVKYIEITDNLTDDLGGTGTDLLFSFENIYAEGKNLRIVGDPYVAGNNRYEYHSVIKNDIVYVSDEIISALISEGADSQSANMDYRVEFGDVVIGSNSSADNFQEAVSLDAQSDQVGVVFNTIQFSELDAYDLNDDGTIGDVEDKVIAKVLASRDTGEDGSSIQQLVVSDKVGGNDSLVIFGVDQVRMGRAEFNLRVNIRRDQDGTIDQVTGTSLSDTLIGDNTGNWFYAGKGTDFIDGIANENIDGQYWKPRDYLRLDELSIDRAEFNAVQVVVNADGTPGLDANKKIQIIGYSGEAAIDNSDLTFLNDANSITLGDGQAIVDASMISDKGASSDSTYVGVKVIRNIDNVAFASDKWIDLSVYENVREDTYGANNTPYNQRDLWGTILDDVMLGDGSLDGGARDRLEGRDGNDRLKGGAWGDELIGGLGDDIIDGGADGVTGDVWRDLDVARYNDNALVRYKITKVYVEVDFDAASDTPVIYDPSGTIESAGIFTLNQDAAAYEAAKDSLKAAYLVVDALGAELGGTGHDLVIDVERLQFADNENVDLGLRIERNDWDSNRAGYEHVSISGTNEGDDIRDYGNGIDFDGDGNTDDDLIARKEIDGRDGDDIIFAYGGGSRIIGGTGSDFIDGGADGTSGNSWDDEDRAVFSGKSSRYSLEGTTKLDPVLQNLAQSLGVDLDAYAEDQEFTLVRDEATENGDVDVLVNIERIEFSDRDFSIKPSIWIERDADGNELRRNIEGSIKSDVLVGGQFNDWIQGRQGDDVIFAGDGGDDINPGAGTDYIDGGANNNYFDDIYWNPTDTVRIDSSFDNFEVAKAQILVSTNTGQPIVSATGKWTIIGYSGEAALLSEKISFVDSADGLTSDTVSAVDIYMISDNRAPSDNAYKGVNIVRNVENLSFNDKWVQIEVEEYTNEYTDWRGDTIRESRRNGTVFSEAIIGGLGMDFIEGREGDDYLFGGADGDRLNGGRGNDILWGGADGNSGDSWRDLDVAEYWNESRERFQIYKVKVDTAQFDNFSAGQTTTIIDAFNVLEEGASYEGYTIADSSDAELSDAYLVVDFLPAALGGAGNDLLIDIEQINFEGETIDLGLRIWADDWNQDEVLDWVRVEGTGEDDDIRAWGDEARLNADSEILGKAGNDILFGYAGGDRLAGGTGNDFIDGGADGITRYGWEPKDEAFFNGVEANYIITNHAYGDPALTELAEELGYADLLATYAPADGEAGPNFTVVRDTKPAQLGGSGTDILVNVEFIGLQDNYLPLTVEKNADMRADFDSDGDGLYDVTGESVDDPNATAEYTVYWVSGTSGSDQISGGIGDDYLSGNAGNDTLVGDRGADYFEPGAGDDYIDGGDNGVFDWNRDDVVRFSGDFADYDIGSGFDDEGRLEVIVTDMREEEDGVNRLVNIERIDFNDQSLSIGLSEREIYLRGDLINGLDIQGSAFDDVIEGSYPTDGNASNLRELGNDYLSGEEGDDILYGYAGQDVFVGGLGNDKIYGGENGVDEFGNEGGDTVIYFQDYANYTIEYKTADGLDADSFVSGGYIVVTDNSDDEFSDGTDEIYGVERIVFADTELTFETKIQSVDADGDGIADIASVTGTMQDDVLFGTELDEIFNGQDGNDVIFGRVGNDLFEDSGTDGEDLYVGGGGEDRLSVALAADAYNVAQTFIGFDEEGQVLRDDGGDIVFFNTADSVSAGATAKAAVKLTNSSNGQVDVVSGLEYVDFNGDLTALSISVGRAKFANDGSLSQIDVFGTLGDDTISADALAASDNFGADEAAAIMAADNFIFGGRGVDLIDAGAGNDQIILHTTTAANGTSDTVIGGDGIDRVDLSGDLADWTFGTVDVDGGTYDTATNGNQSIRMSGVEAVSFDDEILNLVVTSIEIDRNADGEADGYQIGGTLNDDTLISNEGDLRDILKGGAGGDIVVGQAGDDIIIEGAGNDMIVGGAGFDTVSYNDVAADITVTVGGYVLRSTSSSEFVSSFADMPSYVGEADITASFAPQVYAVVEDSYLANVASDFDADNDADTVDVVHIDTNRDGEADSYFADLNNDGTADQFAQGSDTDGFDTASMTLRQITLAYEQANGSAKLFYEDVVSEKVFSATTGSETDILIGVELIEFADQALDLQPSATDQSSFSAANGIVQTREIEGTGFADVIDVEALDEVLTLGGGNDIVRLGSESGSDMVADFDVKSDVSTNYASVESDFDPDNDADTADKVAVDIDGDGQTDGTFADLDNDGVVDRFDAGADDANFDALTMTLQAIEIIDDSFDVIEVEKLLNGTSITSFESLRSRMSDTNQGVQISLGVNEAGEEQQITLEGVMVDELSASNFAFVDVL